MAKTLEELIAEYQNSGAYQALTQDQINAQASNRYQSVYDQKRLSANQAYQTADTALASQLGSLQSTYDKQRESTAKGYTQARSTADRQSLSRGMQRSSYNNATLANIDLEGMEAQADINEAQALKANEINSQRSLYSQQLAQQIAQYDAAQMADTLAYADELSAREYDRTMAAQAAARELAMAIYQAEYQKEQDALAQQNWLAEFELAKSKKSSSSGNKNTNDDKDDSSSPQDDYYKRLLEILGRSSAGTQEKDSKIRKSQTTTAVKY